MRLSRQLSTLVWLPVNALQAVVTMLWMAIWISVALVATALTRSTRVALWLARRVWAPGQIATAIAVVAVSGRERFDWSRPRLLVANHQSWIDIPALFLAAPVPLHFVAKQELARVPFLGAYIRAMGMVFVDRRDLRGAKASVDRVAASLAAGASVVSFPEGTRSGDGRVGRFKSGAFDAVLASGVEVLPVGIVGAGRVLPRGGFRVRPGRIEVRFGEPIATAGRKRSERTELATEIEAAVRRLVEGEPQPGADASV
jgi:1-acyl-sn-glycerol-3-phosphate acyltransferase